MTLFPYLVKAYDVIEWQKVQKIFLNPFFTKGGGGGGVDPIPEGISSISFEKKNKLETPKFP